jgi:hypothetical protein
MRTRLLLGLVLTILAAPTPSFAQWRPRIPIAPKPNLPLPRPVYIPGVRPGFTPADRVHSAERDEKKEPTPWSNNDWVGGFAIFVFAFAATVLVVGGVAASRGAVRGRIRITATPSGDAPEEIRRAWVGLELPLGRTGLQRLEAEGVTSGRGAGVVEGYVVCGKVAVELLAAHAPEAAEWWRRNAPQVLAAGYELLFPRAACQPLDDAGEKKAS